METGQELSVLFHEVLIKSGLWFNLSNLLEGIRRSGEVKQKLLLQCFNLE